MKTFLAIIKKLVSYYKIKVYIIKYRWLKMSITWYVGRGKGTLVVSGQPNFNKPLMWTKVIYRVGHINETPITNTKLIKANVRWRK